MKAKHQRLLVISLSVISMVVGALIFLNHFKDNLVFFYNPTQIIEHKVSANKLIRVGGLVKNNSVSRNSNVLSFVITDNQNEIKISYQGIVPNLFREGQGVVAQGVFKQDNIFYADNLLAKHDEKYMPPELVETLKNQGHWKK